MTFEVKFSIPGQAEKKIALEQSPIKIGSLLSNDIILPRSDAEPIHALLEKNPSNDSWSITDLGSESGVKLNKKLINVESALKSEDIINIGNISITFSELVKQAQPLPPPIPVPLPPPPPSSEVSAPKSAVKQIVKSLSVQKETEKKNDLFSSSQSKSDGEILEVISYWGETILEVEHFQASEKGFDKVTIGDSKKNHFAASGTEQITSHDLAVPDQDGYKLNLLPSMSARLRKNGKIEKVEGGSHILGKRDISQVKHGELRYFFLYTHPTIVDLPKNVDKDPFFKKLITISSLIYIILAFGLWFIEPNENEKLPEDIWSIVHVPETKKLVKKSIPKEVSLSKIKEPPPPRVTPPKPKPKPIEAADNKEKEKPIPKKTKARKLEPNMKDNLEQAKTEKMAQSKKQKKSSLKLAGGGDKSKRKQKNGGLRKGKKKTNLKGNKAAKNSKSSGVNLSSLGLGVGKVKNAGGAGAIHTNFQNSAGGAGGGSGSEKKTFGLGGLKSSAKSIGLAGTANSMNKFGAGSSSIIGGGNSKSMDKAFGSGKKSAKVNVRAGDPLVSGGLSQQEILTVIRKQINQIRHCYERLLQASPGSKGRVKTKFTIGSNGRVSSANIESSTLNSSSMSNCVVNAIQKWQFPKPRGGASVTVNYPFIFNSI